MQREMEILERDLALLSRALRYPPAPDLTVSTAERLRERPAAPFRLRLAAALAAAAVALVAGLALVAPAREAVADLFDRINIFAVDELPPGLSYRIEGREVSLEEARKALGFELALPDGAEPSRVLLQDFGAVKAAVLFFEPEDAPGYALFETNGQVSKGVPSASPEAEFVSGLGESAYWLTGLRLVQYETDFGEAIYESRRVTAQNTLVWSRDGFVFRIEGPLAKDAAVELAQSLR